MPSDAASNENNNAAADPRRTGGRSYANPLPEMLPDMLPRSLPAA